MKRARGLDGQPIGAAHGNPAQDARQCEVEFTDGTREWHQAENMFAQSDEEGDWCTLMKEMIMGQTVQHCMVRKVVQ